MSNNSSESVQQVGAVVEVKNQDGVYQEATINKLTDASIYTVGKSITKPPAFPPLSNIYDVYTLCCYLNTLQYIVQSKATHEIIDKTDS